jgi:hypothetical protein
MICKCSGYSVRLCLHAPKDRLLQHDSHDNGACLSLLPEAPTESEGRPQRRTSKKWGGFGDELFLAGICKMRNISRATW